jgi:hypothetical protein
MFGYKWPRAVPYAPLGNPEVRGMVLGQLYDQGTGGEAVVPADEHGHGAGADNVNMRSGLDSFVFDRKNDATAAAAASAIAGNASTNGTTTASSGSYHGTLVSRRATALA